MRAARAAGRASDDRIGSEGGMRANRAVCGDFGGGRRVRGRADGERMGGREEGEGRAVCVGAGLHSGGPSAPDPALFVWIASLFVEQKREKGQNMYLAGGKQDNKESTKGVICVDQRRADLVHHRNVFEVPIEIVCRDVEVASGLLVSGSAQMDSMHYFSHAHNDQTSKRCIQQPASQLLGVLFYVVRMQMRERHKIVVDFVATDHRIRHLLKREIVREDEVVLCLTREPDAHG